MKDKNNNKSVRVSEETHRYLKIAAAEKGVTINELAELMLKAPLLQVQEVAQ